MKGVVVSPDGKYFATCRIGNVALWDTATGVYVRTLQCPSTDVRAVAWSPDGSMLAAALHDRTARVFDTVTGVHVCWSARCTANLVAVTERS